MRQTYAHEALLDLPPDADQLDIDLNAPGAAITVALCGHWEHQPPCPLAPHHTRADRDGGQVRLRILFATESDREQTVRERIDQALGTGSLTGPDGMTTAWQVRHSGPSAVTVDESDHAARLASGN